MRGHIKKQRVLWAGAGMALALVLGACSETPIDEIQAGDCVQDDTELGGTATGLEVKDCTEEHNGEAFFRADVPDGQTATDFAEDVCYGDAFTEYVGVEYLESEIGAYYFTVEDLITCYLFEPVEGDFTGAAKVITESLRNADR